jgi:hypothetical protein
LAVPLLAPSVAAQTKWFAQAPGPNTQGQVEGVNDGEVVGAVNAVAVHPTNADIVYIGAVNGGVWRTDNAMSPKPSWRPLTDGQGSLSIGAVEIDPMDATSATVVVGAGRFSSLLGKGGARIGAVRTTDGGTTWSLINGGGTLVGLNVSGIAARGTTIVISVNAADNPTNVGVWRTVNTGASWTKLSSASGSGLPSGFSTDIAGDRSNNSRLFAVVGGRGIFRSTDTGATWTKVSNAAIDALLSGADNGKLAVGSSNNVYVAIVRFDELAGVFRSGNAGQTWTAMDLPSTSEGGAHIGRQGSIHLSIAADRGNANLVYLGGDRQPARFVSGSESRSFPNSIGARDYSGRLFRGDASRPSGSQWVHLTHSNTLGVSGGGTISGSAPHADSRDMAIAANGVLIEGDDGGVYRRTNPQSNAGDWFSMNGDLQATEFHSVAWDSNVHLVIGGAQDTGTPQQRLRSDARWQSVSTGDGGVVAVDDSSAPGFSTRYSSFQFLGDVRRETYDSNNVLQDRIPLPMTVVGGGNPLVPQFYTPIRLNAVTPTRLIIGGGNAVYESTDEGDTVEEIGTGIVANDTGSQIIAYGAAGNPDALYVGSGNRVFIRTGPPPAGLIRSDTYPGARVIGIALNPANAATAYVIDEQQVFRTTNSGQTWTNVAGNLQQLKPGSLRSITHTTETGAGSVVVGSDRGVFEAPGPALSTWHALNNGFPGAPVYHLEYDSVDRILLAGTLGRGAWTLSFATQKPPLTLTGPVAASGSTGVPAGTPRAAEAQPGATGTPPVELRPGVIVDADRDHVYIMTPDGATEAVTLREGRQLWRNDTVAKPLGVAGERVLAQVENAPGNVLQVVMLDRATGRSMVTADRPLPAGVSASVSETNEGAFVAAARTTGAQPVVAWEYQPRRLRGVPPGTEAAIFGRSGGAPVPRGSATQLTTTMSGAFSVDVTTGDTAPADAPGPVPSMMSRSTQLPAPERVATLPTPQFLSADGRHVLVSERVGDARVFERYRLTVFDRTSLQRIGVISSHLAQVAFVVTGSQMIYETGPYSRRVGNELISEPLKVRSVDLATGKEIWSRPVRDTVARTPPPA